MSYSQRYRYLVVGLVGLVELGLLLTVTVRVSRVSIMVSVSVSIYKYRCEYDTLN